MSGTLDRPVFAYSTYEQTLEFMEWKEDERERKRQTKLEEIMAPTGTLSEKGHLKLVI